MNNGKCYFISQERMGWIEAKKKCELMQPGSGAFKPSLVAIETPEERDLLIKEISKSSRSRFEFWTAGNDIEEENVGEWSGTRGRLVPDFGWIDPPAPSAEKNCLTWSISISRRTSRMNEGWHMDSCCNNVRFICEV